MHVSNMKLLVDVGQLPASVFEEGLANENERTCEDVEKQQPEKGGECPAILVEEVRAVRDQERQLSHEVEDNGEQQSDCDKNGVRNHVSVRTTY